MGLERAEKVVAIHGSSPRQVVQREIVLVTTMYEIDGPHDLSPHRPRRTCSDSRRAMIVVQCTQEEYREVEGLCCGQRYADWDLCRAAGSA